MSEDLGSGTLTGEHQPPEKIESTNTKIHGEPPEGSPMPGVEREEGSEVKEEVETTFPRPLGYKRLPGLPRAPTKQILFGRARSRGQSPRGSSPAGSPRSCPRISQ